MIDTKRAARTRDLVDRFAEELVRHPDRAAVLKRDFRSRIGINETRHPQVEADALDPEDLWDNVPV